MTPILKTILPTTTLFLYFTVAAFGQTRNSDIRILSAFHGLDALPARARLLCGLDVAGEDGIPVTFSVQLNDRTLNPGVFAVETSDGEMATPVCATLRPALESLEKRTVLLAGPFGTAIAPPRAVEIVGQLQDVNGNSLDGLREPVALGDDDPDNHVVACLADSSPAMAISIKAGLFHDPGDDPNPEPSIDVH